MATTRFARRPMMGRFPPRLIGAALILACIPLVSHALGETTTASTAGPPVIHVAAPKAPGLGAPPTPRVPLPTLSDAQAATVGQAINSDPRSVAILNQTQTTLSPQNVSFNPLYDRAGAVLAGEATVLLSQPYTGQIVVQIAHRDTSPPTPGWSFRLNVVALTSVRFLVDLSTGGLIGWDTGDAQDVSPASTSP